jgi:D-aspartate ligase
MSLESAADKGLQPPVNLTTSPQTRPPVPAVVVEGTLNGLGVIRSLSRGGMPIYLLEETSRCAARWSRYCRYVRLGALALEGAELVDALVRLGRKLACRPVLILTGDRSVNSVSENRQLIEPLYRISLPSREMVRTLADKALFQELAEREGFAVPRSVSLTHSSQLARLSELSLPLILKPADKTLVLNGTVERAIRAETLAEAQQAAVHMLASAPQVIVQEWVDGPDTELYFTLFTCDRDARPVGVFAGRKLVCSPPAIGSTAVCVAAAPEISHDLVTATLQFVSRVGYRGLGSLEFKRHRGTGQFFIIEPTVGRTDWQEEIATLCGVNLPLMAYQAELGQPIQPPSTSCPPVAWRQSAGFRAPLAPGMHTVDGMFRWSDPLPGLYYYVYERALARLWNKVSARSGARLARGGAKAW